MRNVLKILLLTVILPACAPKAYEYTEVDPALAPYFTAFKTEADARGVGINISRLRVVFDQTLNGTNRAGKCTILEVQVGTLLKPRKSTELLVQINPETFGQSSEYGKIEVIFHELGHCLLGYSHNDSQITALTSNGVVALPASWMSTYHFAEQLSQQDQNLLLGYYINQIFDPNLSQEDLSQVSTLQSFKLFSAKTAQLKLSTENSSN